MIKYILILTLSVLLGISSYLLYKNEYIVVNIETGGEGLKEGIVQGGILDNRTASESEELKPHKE